MIDYKCPRCGQRMKSSDDLAGQSEPCPKCTLAVDVPLAKCQQHLTLGLSHRGKIILLIVGASAALFVAAGAGYATARARRRDVADIDWPPLAATQRTIDVPVTEKERRRFREEAEMLKRADRSLWQMSNRDCPWTLNELRRDAAVAAVVYGVKEEDYASVLFWIFQEDAATANSILYLSLRAFKEYDLPFCDTVAFQDRLLACDLNNGGQFFRSHAVRWAVLSCIGEASYGEWTGEEMLYVVRASGWPPGYGNDAMQSLAEYVKSIHVYSMFSGMPSGEMITERMPDYGVKYVVRALSLMGRDGRANIVRLWNAPHEGHNAHEQWIMTLRETVQEIKDEVLRQYLVGNE